MFYELKNKVKQKLVESKQLNILNCVLLFIVLFSVQAIAGGFTIYHSYLSHEEAAIDSLLQRVQRDISFDNGTWDLSEYNADSLIPGRFRLYVFAADGYVVDRWRPIPGFLNLTDVKYLLNFQEIQTTTAVTGENWRMHTHPIENENEDILGVITVAHHQEDDSNIEDIDQRLKEAVDVIRANLSIEEGRINTRNLSRRVIPFDISFQVVDQFNHILIYNSNINSMGRIPGYIDPSYVRNEMNISQTRQVKSSIGASPFLIKSRPLTNGDQNVGVVIVASSVSILYSILKVYFLVSGLLSVALTSLLAICAYIFAKKISRTAVAQAITKSNPVIAIDAITSIHFSKKERVLRINSHRIHFTYATNQYYMCSALFASPKKKWETDELIDKFGEDLSKNSWRKVYDTMAAINAKTASIMQPKLIVVSNKTYQINPELLSKLG